MTQITREETHCHHYIGYSFQLAAKDLLYASSQRQDSISHSLCYTSHEAVAGKGKSSIGPPRGRKEGNVLFNDALNTFYLRLYGIRHNYGKVPLR